MVRFLNQPNKDIGFSDESEYLEKQIGLKEIMLRHIRKISDICCKEFTGGYWTKKPVKIGTGVVFVEDYHEDVRQAYCNAVDFLIDIVYPQADKDLKNFINHKENYDDEKIEIKIRKKRLTFKEINKMFERIDFFKGTESVDE